MSDVLAATSSTSAVCDAASDHGSTNHSPSSSNSNEPKKEESSSSNSSGPPSVLTDPSRSEQTTTTESNTTTDDMKDVKRMETPPPDNKCSICLGPLQDLSYPNECSHKFCFVCLLEWSKVKLQCPLCKVPFRHIIHAIKSESDYEKFEPPVPAPPERLSRRDPERRFRYQTTMTAERMEVTRQIRELQGRILRQQHHLGRLMHGLPSPSLTVAACNGTADGTFQPSQWHQRALDAILLRRMSRDTRQDREALQRYQQLLTGMDNGSREQLVSNPEFRRLVYERGLRVRPMNADVTGGRVRQMTPEFLRDNPAAMHRLVPWLTRELNVLLHNDTHRVQRVTDILVGLLRRYPLEEEGEPMTAYRVALAPYLQQHTDLFLHAFNQFAHSPFDMQQYDRRAQYSRRGTSPVPVSEPQQGGASNGTNDEIAVVAESSAISEQQRRREQRLSIMERFFNESETADQGTEENGETGSSSTTVQNPSSSERNSMNMFRSIAFGASSLSSSSRPRSFQDRLSHLLRYRQQQRRTDERRTHDEMQRAQIETTATNQGDAEGSTSTTDIYASPLELAAAIRRRQLKTRANRLNNSSSATSTNATIADFFPPQITTPAEDTDPAESSVILLSPSSVELIDLTNNQTERHTNDTQPPIESLTDDERKDAEGQRDKRGRKRERPLRSNQPGPSWRQDDVDWPNSSADDDDWPEQSLVRRKRRRREPWTRISSPTPMDTSSPPIVAADEATTVETDRYRVLSDSSWFSPPPNDFELAGDSTRRRAVRENQNNDSNVENQSDNGVVESQSAPNASSPLGVAASATERQHEDEAISANIDDGVRRRTIDLAADDVLKSDDEEARVKSDSMPSTATPPSRPSGDADDVEVLCEMKPKHLRTPPTVTLSGDETTPPGTRETVLDDSWTRGRSRNKAEGKGKERRSKTEKQRRRKRERKRSRERQTTESTRRRRHDSTTPERSFSKASTDSSSPYSDAGNEYSKDYGRRKRDERRRKSTGYGIRKHGDHSSREGSQPSSTSHRHQRQ